MTDTNGVSRVIKAPRHKIYQAFLDPKQVAAWMAPDNMQLQMHSFEGHEGGKFRISLLYRNPEDAQQYGKTEAGNDTYHGCFVELVPDEKIIQAIEFETQDANFTGEMLMTVTLCDVDGGTQVTLHYDNVPSGIRPEDNAEGSRQSLKNLAALVE
jgi:uncharacterized protein YndB with AHSA1/START domain